MSSGSASKPPTEETHFNTFSTCMHDHRDVDQVVKSKVSLLAQLPLDHDGPAQRGRSSPSNQRRQSTVFRQRTTTPDLEVPTLIPALQTAPVPAASHGQKKPAEPRHHPQKGSQTWLQATIPESNTHKEHASTHITLGCQS